MMSARLRVASCLLLSALFASAVYFLPQRLFGKVSLLEHDSNEPNMALCPGRQILGLRLEYGKKLNVAITRMAPHTDYEARLSYPASVRSLLPFLPPLNFLSFATSECIINLIMPAAVPRRMHRRRAHWRLLPRRLKRRQWPGTAQYRKTHVQQWQRNGGHCGDILRYHCCCFFLVVLAAAKSCDFQYRCSFVWLIPHLHGDTQ